VNEAKGSIWDYFGKAIIAILINGDVRGTGEAVMGAGSALEAKRHFPGLSRKLGLLIQTAGNKVHLLGDGLISFPIKEHWWQKADLPMIRRSCLQLVALADQQGWTNIVLPKLECADDDLRWEDLSPVMSAILDHRFTVLQKSHPCVPIAGEHSLRSVSKGRPR
jgi:hypothetical protein